MIQPLIQFIVSATIIAAAGVYLTRFADNIATVTKLGRLLVGSLFLAAATSLPELSVDISAVRMGMADLAVGDLMGSSLFNLFILAILDLLHRSKGKMFSREATAHALSATMSISLTALAAIGILLGNRVFGVALGPFGIGTLGILVAYVLGFRLVYYDQRAAQAGEASLLGQEPPEKSDKSLLKKAIIGYLVCGTIIFFVAPYLAESAGKLAELSGLGKTFIGTTLVALSTSLPELVTSLAAVRMGAFDLALGNIFGSNSFNMILLVPLDLVHPGVLLASVSIQHAITALATILITAIAVMGQLYHIEPRKKFIEPDALLVITLVLAAIGTLYWIR